MSILFIIDFSKDLVLVRWQEDYGNEENLNDIPYAQVNLQDEETICVVCRDGSRSYASVLCGHRMLCEDCANQLVNNFCPICNGESNGVILIWQ